MADIIDLNHLIHEKITNYLRWIEGLDADKILQVQSTQDDFGRSLTKITYADRTHAVHRAFTYRPLEHILGLHLPISFDEFLQFDREMIAEFKKTNVNYHPIRVTRDASGRLSYEYGMSNGDGDINFGEELPMTEEMIQKLSHSDGHIIMS